MSKENNIPAEQVKPTITVNDVPYEIASLSEEIQNLVRVYNNWNVKEAEAMGEVNILQAAKQSLSAEIIAKVQAETDASANATDGVVTTNVTAGDDEVIVIE